jgi:hypothetical protein
VEVQLLGNIHFPKNITYIQSVVNASSNKYWISMAGKNVVFSGNPLNPFGGIVNGFGQAWYEAAPNTLPLGGLVSPQCSAICKRSKLSRRVACSATHVQHLGQQLYHSMDQGREAHRLGFPHSRQQQPLVSVPYLIRDRTFLTPFPDGIKIDASYDLGKPSVFPFNTDGWDVSGNNILIEDSWVFNGDDCVAVNSGNNITFRNNVCIGGHGSSVSSANGVTNVLFKDITMIDSLYAS